MFQIDSLKSSSNLSLKSKIKSVKIPINAKTEVGASALSETREVSPESRYDTDSHILSRGLISRKEEYHMATEKSGFIRIPRSLLISNVWNCLRMKYRHVFFVLLSKCNWEEGIIDDNGVKIKLNPGQVCVSYRQLVDWCNENVRYKEDQVDKNIVERAVSVFLKVGFARQEVRHTRMVITITYPGIYNDNEITTETPTETKPRHNRDTIKEEEEEKEKIDHQPLTPSKNVVGVGDSSFLKIEEEKTLIAGIASLTKKELEECIKTKGSLEEVEKIVREIQDWPERKHTITNWKVTIQKWNAKNKFIDRSKENEKLAKSIVKKLEGNDACIVQIYTDKQKDQRGILLQTRGNYPNPIFIPFSVREFKEKMCDALEKKRVNLDEI